MLSRWDALTLVLRDGRACIDNNAAERAMRPIPLGRKNWLHAGSDAGGERAAAIFSLTETAKLNVLRSRGLPAPGAGTYRRSSGQTGP